MSNKWPTARLAEVLKPVSRPTTPDVSRSYRLLGVRLDGNGAFHRETVTGAETSASQLFEVTDGDFIYSRLFAWRGAFGLIGRDLAGAYVSSEFPTFRADEQRLDPRFLNYWFRLPDTLRRVEADCTGSTPLTRNRFKETFFLNLEIALPSIGEQRRIVDLIEAIAGKIEDARRLRGEAEEAVGGLLASRINEIFCRLARDFQPQPLSGFDPHVTSGPRNWAKHYEVTGHRFYRAQDIGPSGAVLNDSRVYVSPPPGGQGRSATLVAGDLMIVITGATVGRVALFANGMEPGFVSQHVAICRLPRNQVNSEFVLWGLRGPDGQSQLLGQRYGQGKPGLNLENVGALSLPFPPIEEQQRVVQYLRAYGRVVDESAVEQESSVALMRGMLPSVLDKAFRGEM